MRRWQPVNTCLGLIDLCIAKMPCVLVIRWAGWAMRSSELFKKNIETLLRTRHQSRHELARWCRRSDAWLSKILGKDDRNLPMKYLDRIAEFFGIAPYQLFQPGISPLLERRTGADRRKGRDRRLSAVVLSEKPGDVDAIHLIRALSPRGRQRALEHLVDLVNDELPRSRTLESAAGGPSRTRGTPPVTRTRKTRETPPTPKTE